MVCVDMSDWKEVVDAKVGYIFVDRHEEGLRFIIMRGPCSLCAYVGIPESHPLAGHSYDDLPIECHGGLTFSQLGGKKEWPSGCWWYGWDYTHCDDYSTYYDKPGFDSNLRSNGKKWTVKDVKSDSGTTLYEFKKLLSLAENIANKYQCNTVTK